MRTAIELLRLQCNDWGVELDRHQLSLLNRYGELLAAYDLANVIGTKDQKRIVLEHLVDSLSCLTAEEVHWGTSMVDVGTGGGLPGIPLAVVRPELRVTLLEATEKKVRFLEHAQAALALPNLEILHSRAENAGREQRCREAFDLATARALAALPVVVEYCAPLVRTRGIILAMKARMQEEETSQGIAASRKLAAELREVREVEYRTDLPQKERKLVVFEKVGATPRQFPRRVGLAKKRSPDRYDGGG